MSASVKAHVAIVVDSIIPGGGVNNIALNQSIALSQHFSVTIVCAHGKTENTGISTHQVNEPKLFWLKRYGHFLRALILSSRFCDKLKQIDAEHKIDFILFHSHLHAATAREKLRQDLKMGMLIHGDIFTRPVGTYDPLLTRLYKWSSVKAYKSIELIVALSPYMREKAITYGAAKESVAVIPNGINIQDQPNTKKIPVEPNKFTVLFIGRLSKEKDPITLLKAMLLLDERINLSIGGDGPLHNDIKNFIHDRGLSNRVTLHGHISAQKVNELYQQSDVFCIPSVSDPLPTVVLEAMSTGLPVIGTNVEGIPFMVEHNKNGLIVPPSNPEALAKAIEHLFNSPALRTEYGVAAKKRISDTFSLSSSTKKLIEHIERTMNCQQGKKS